MRGSIGHKWADLASFGQVQPIFFNDLGGKHLAPKAEVTGSNPVGCANDFNGLHDGSGGSDRGYVGIILAVVTPFVWEFRIAHHSNFDNWKWTVNASKLMNCPEQNGKLYA